VVQSQPGQIVQETYLKKKSSRKRAGGVAQGIDPEFKAQCCTKKKKKTFVYFSWWDGVW
jgi:hypothetical protein